MMLLKADITNINNRKSVHRITLLNYAQQKQKYSLQVNRVELRAFEFELELLFFTRKRTTHGS